MRYIRLIPLLLMLFTVTSCYDDNTFRKQIDLPSTPAKVMVFGYLTPEKDTINIFVGKSIAINDTVTYGDNPITNATVQLDCEGKKAIVPWRKATSTNGNYEPDGSYTPGHYFEGGYKIAVRDFPLTPGKQINLTVSTDLGTVSSSCIIPEVQNVRSILDKVWLSSENQYSNELNINVILKEFGNSQEYYHFYAESGVRNAQNSFSYVSVFDLKNGSEFFTHKPTDSQEIKYRINKYYYNYQGDNTDDQIDSIFIYLAKTDEAYYKFNSTYKSYQDIDGNPFAEPIMVYSNIKGGLGVFCAYRLKKYAYPLSDYIK